MSSTASAPAESAPAERRRARPGARSRRPDRHPEGLERLRILLAGSMGAVLTGYALLVPVAFLLLASGGSGSIDGAFAAAVPMWLAAHLIPIEVDGSALGVLPLLPTLVVVGVVAIAAGWSVRRLGGRIRHDAGAVVAGQAGAAAAVAVLAGALLPGDVSVTTPWASMVGAGLLAGLAAGAGVLRACGLPPAWTRKLHGWPRAGLAGARAGAAGLLLSGAVVVLLALAVRAGAVAATFSSLAPGAGASAGVLLLAVGYLPNAMVAGTAWSLGPGFAVGAAQFGPFGTMQGPLPPFPLFAAVPPEAVPAWAAVVLLLPLGAGVVVGRVTRRAIGPAAPLQERLAAAAAAAAVTAVGAGTVAALAGGSLAGGPYDPVSLSPFGVVATALVLLGVPAMITCAGVDELLGRRPVPVRRPLVRDRARPAGASRRDGQDAARRSGSSTERDRPSRPRTVGDLVAEKEPARSEDAADEPVGGAGSRTDTDGGGSTGTTTRRASGRSDRGATGRTTGGASKRPAGQGGTGSGSSTRATSGSATDASTAKTASALEETGGVLGKTGSALRKTGNALGKSGNASGRKVGGGSSEATSGASSGKAGDAAGGKTGNGPRRTSGSAPSGTTADPASGTSAGGEDPPASAE